MPRETSATESAGWGSITEARFTAVTFRQDDKTGKAAPAPAAIPAGKALPPANTPAGSKARVEDSMKKDEQRVDDADKKANDTGSAKLKEGM